MYKTALAARENAYAPYSGFKVGAAIKTVDGTEFGGCNVENVAYPEGTCAEAGAIAAMVAAGYTEIAEVLIVADSETPVTPCGGCRQKLAEFCKPGVPVTLANLEGPMKTMTLTELIPGVFDREQMGTG
ncbi:MAG: cytidine deaminase [Pseudomonadota bacterium]